MSARLSLVLLSTAPLLLFLVSCGGSSTPDGYLWKNATGVSFIQFTESQTYTLAGSIDMVAESSDQPPSMSTQAVPFTGIENGSSLTVTFSFLGISASYNGQLEGSRLLLNFPQADGTIQQEEFDAASFQDYNQAVANLNRKSSQLDQQYENAQATATTLQDDSDATATAGQATATAEQAEQQAVQSANQQLADDLSALQNDATALSQFSEQNTLQGYANDWKQMQTDYGIEQQDAKQGCSDNNGSQVSDDAAQVSDDEAQISDDDAQFSDDGAQYNQDFSPVQNDMQAVQNDWTQLQQAVANNPIGTPGLAYSPDDVQAALAQGQSAEQQAQSIWKSAQSKVTQYDQKASALNQAASAIPGNMNC